MSFHAYAAASGLLFFLGILGLIARRNLFNQILCVQLLFVGVALFLAALNKIGHFGERDGAVLAAFVLVVGAAETIGGLALLAFWYRRRQTARTEDLTGLKF